MSLLIAIDGPSGSGKSTTAKLLAARLGLGYLDTGAMYRAATTEYLRRYPDGASGEEAAALVAGCDLVVETSPDAPAFVIDGTDVTLEIREPLISAAVSQIATNLEVRRLLT
ncbi:MAG TPA: (d)CMP kinase, partial [Arachnia sp.]|nr:(d)CMP kinase [Arachnia sp.]